MDQTFRAIIEVVNRATAPLRKIETDIAALSAPVAGVRLAVAQLGRETGIYKLGEHAAHATEKVRHLGRELGAIMAPLAIIGGIASVEGLFEASKKSAEFGEALGHSSEKTGVDIPQLARMHYVAQLEDIDPAVFDKAVAKLNSNLFKAMHGKNKDFAGMMMKFEGPNWQKKIKGPEDALAAISDAYRKHNNVVTRAGIVTTAFGDRMGIALKPILGKTREEVKSLGDEFERFYGRWTPERVEQAKENADNWKRLSAAGQGLAVTIGGTVAPALMEMIVPMREWIANNKELIASKVQNTVREIGDSLKGTDWRGVASGIAAVFGAFKNVAGLLGAKGTVIAAAAILFGPIALSAFNAARALAVLAVQFGVVAARVGLLVSLEVATFFSELVTGIRLAIPAMAALDLAMDANPIGAVIAAVAALAAVAYVVYDHWKPISEFFVGIWNKIKAAWEPVREWFSDLFNGIGVEFQKIYKTIKPVIDAIERFWNRRSSGDHKTSADREADQRHTPIARAHAAASRAAFNKVVGHAAAVAGSVILQSLPGAAAVQNLHDVGKQDRIAHERLQRGTSPSAIARGGSFRAADGKVDVTLDFRNMPRGVQTQTATKGNGLNLKVGKSFHE